MRKRYISLYASLLKSDPNRTVVDDNKDIEELDRELDIELIIQWRYGVLPLKIYLFYFVVFYVIHRSTLCGC